MYCLDDIIGLVGSIMAKMGMELFGLQLQKAIPMHMLFIILLEALILWTDQKCQLVSLSARRSGERIRQACHSYIADQDH